MTRTDGHGAARVAGSAVLLRAALDAGAAILRLRAEGVATSFKADRSPVTAADEAAEEIILRSLGAHFPGIPVVAEEAFSAGEAPPGLDARFFLVDPLDGTREFIDGRDEYTVNIALIENGAPVYGVVVAPSLFLAFTGGPKGAHRITIDRAGGLSEPHAIRTRACPPRPVAIASRSHRTPETDRYLARFPLEKVIAVGSSLKFCRLAEGSADLYPCLGRTMEWDTAAGQAVLQAAGGRVTVLDGNPLRYGKRNRASEADFANPYFVATGGVMVPSI